MRKDVYYNFDPYSDEFKGRLLKSLNHSKMNLRLIAVLNGEVLGAGAFLFLQPQIEAQIVGGTIIAASLLHALPAALSSESTKHMINLVNRL